MKNYTIKQRVDYIINVCKGKAVLHVGCADAPNTRNQLDNATLLHSKIESVASIQYGIDLNPEGIQILKDAGYKNLAIANIEEIAQNNPFGKQEFDVILAGEVIEHLSNPGLFLDAIRPLLKKPSSRLVLTTINAYSAYRFVYALLTGGEMVHPEHVYYFSFSTIKRLLSQHGYEIENFAFYPVGHEHEKGLKHGFYWLLWFADRCAKKFNPMLADGLMVTCRLC